MRPKEGGTPLSRQDVLRTWEGGWKGADTNAKNVLSVCGPVFGSSSAAGVIRTNKTPMAAKRATAAITNLEPGVTARHQRHHDRLRCAAEGCIRAAQ
jgi:hypothetical protein